MVNALGYIRFYLLT